MAVWKRTLSILRLRSTLARISPGSSPLYSSPEPSLPKPRLSCTSTHHRQHFHQLSSTLILLAIHSFCTTISYTRSLFITPTPSSSTHPTCVSIEKDKQSTKESAYHSTPLIPHPAITTLYNSNAVNSLPIRSYYSWPCLPPRINSDLSWLDHCILTISASTSANNFPLPLLYQNPPPSRTSLTSASLDSLHSSNVIIAAALTVRVLAARNQRAGTMSLYPLPLAL